MTPAAITALCLAFFSVGVCLGAWFVHRITEGERRERMSDLERWRAEAMDWRAKHNARALRSGRGAIYAVQGGKGPYAP